MNSKQVSFEDKQFILYEDIASLRAQRILLRDLFGEINKYENVYETMGESRRVIENALSNDFVITLAKLFDISSDPNIVHLKSLIVETTERAPGSIISNKRNEYLDQIRDVKRRLDAPRDTSRAHNYPSKPDPFPSRTWSELDSWTDLAEEIFMCCMKSLGRVWQGTRDGILSKKLPRECLVLLDKYKEMIEENRAKREQILK